MALAGTIAYLNGTFLPLEEARVSILDRGFQFADGVYELIPVYEGFPFRLQAHLARLERSLAEIGLHAPLERQELTATVADLIRRNAIRDGKVYIQVTRGAAERDHAFPAEATATVVMTCAPAEPIPGTWLAEGISAITAEDIRWARCDIKSIALLPNVMLRQRAAESRALEGIWLHQGQVTEGAASNVFAVMGGEARTPSDGPRVLSGITRDVVLELAQEQALPIGVGPITEGELRAAEEIWTTSSTKEVLPVTRIDDQPVGSGRPGPLFRTVREALRTRVRSEQQAAHRVSS